MSLKLVQFDNYQKGKNKCFSFNIKKDIKAPENFNEKDLKKSEFIYEVENDKNYIVFNSMTATLIKLEEQNIKLFKKLLKNKIPKNLNFLKLMFKYGFLISTTTDEKEQMRSHMMSARFRTDFLTLTLLTTNSCNFKCPYCYEGKKKKANSMNLNIQEKIIEMIEGLSNKIEGIRVMWFGGEPLVAFNVIENLSKKIINICEKKNINFSAGIITNGYLLTKDVIRKLKKYIVNSIQITIDGPKNIHDKRRFLPNGKGSYDKILQNILEAVKHLNSITIRINLDKENVPHIEKFLLDLQKRRLGKKISIYLSKVFLSPGINYEKNKILSMKEFTQIKDRLYKKIEKLKIYYPNYKIFPKLNAQNCFATIAMSYVIDPDGEFYKCTSDIGDVSKSIGNIKDMSGKIISGIGCKNKNMCFQYMSFDPTQHPICGKCCFLPICSGGCARKHVENSNYARNCSLKIGLKETIQNQTKSIFKL